MVKKTEPRTRIPSTVRPSIRPATPPHGECWYNGWPEKGASFPRIGDVRRCEHGVVQLMTETTSRHVAGPGTHWWRDLHPFWHWKTHRIAVAALNADQDF